MGDRIVCDPSLVESNRLAIKEVGQSLIGRRGVAQRASRKINARIKILVQLAFHTQANAQTGTVTILSALLGEVLAADTDITREAKATENILQGTQLLVLVLGLGADQRKLRLGIGCVGRCLTSELLRFRCRLLCLSGRGL